jgi:hypothetical protein
MREWAMATRTLTDPATDPEGIVAEGVAAYRSAVVEFCAGAAETDRWAGRLR